MAEDAAGGDESVLNFADYKHITHVKFRVYLQLIFFTNAFFLTGYSWVLAMKWVRDSRRLDTISTVLYYFLQVDVTYLEQTKLYQRISV